MGKYIDRSLLKMAFERLSSFEMDGKRATERTSAVLYFLAFDAAVRELECPPPVDLDPRKEFGKMNRHAITTCFVRFVQIESGQSGFIRHVKTLGLIEQEKDGTDPEKRISANFLTTVVKQASEAAKPVAYPSRPATPVLELRGSADLPWSIDHHSRWEVNLPRLLEDIRSSSPFTDLAIFLAREEKFPPEISSVKEALEYFIGKTFTDKLCEFWTKKIAQEMRFFKGIDNPFSEEYSVPFSESESTSQSTGSDLKKMSKIELIARIKELEQELTEL